MSNKISHTNPLVSIVIPTFNRAGKIKASINKALSQNYPNIEIIVVDDGSADETESVVTAFAREEKRIRYFRIPNSGISAARNKGAIEARGEFITFIDDDDELLPSYLEAVVPKIRAGSDKIGAVGSGFILEDQSGFKSYSCPRAEPFWDCIVGSGWTFRRDVFIKTNLWFDESFRGHEDSEFSIRFRQKYDVLVIDQPLRIYRMTFTNFKKKYLSLSSDRSRDYTYYKKFIEKHFEVFKKAGPDAVAMVTFRAGVFFGQSGRMGESRDMLKTSLKSQFSLRALLYFLFTFFGFRTFFWFDFFKNRTMRFLRVFFLNKSQI